MLQFAKGYTDIIMGEPILIVLLVLLSIMILLNMGLLITRPDGRYHCHEPGCGKSFTTMDELLSHLGNIHNYDSSSISQIAAEIKRLRG